MRNCFGVFMLFLIFASSTNTSGEALILFDSLLVDISEKKLANINYASHKKGKTLKNHLKKEIGKSANFGGKYRLSAFGCGSMCQGFAAIDIDSGNIVDIAQANIGACFSENSQLLIINPHLESTFGNSIPKWASSKYYQITKEGFKLLHETKTSYSGKCKYGQ